MKIIYNLVFLLSSGLAFSQTEAKRPSAQIKPIPSSRAEKPSSDYFSPTLSPALRPGSEAKGSSAPVLSPGAPAQRSPDNLNSPTGAASEASSPVERPSAPSQFLDESPTPFIRGEKNTINTEKNKVGGEQKSASRIKNSPSGEIRVIKKEGFTATKSKEGISFERKINGISERLTLFPGDTVYGDGSQFPLKLGDSYYTEYAPLLTTLKDINILSPLNPEYPLKKTFIFENFGGRGPNSASWFSSSAYVRLDDFIILGVSYERSSWLAKYSNTGKFTESYYLDGCMLFSLQLSWLSLQPCAKIGYGEGVFSSRNLLNEIVITERDRAKINRPYVRIETYLPLLFTERVLTIDFNYGFSNDPYIYGNFIQAYAKFPYGISFGYEIHGRERQIVSAGLTFALWETKPRIVSP